MARWKLFSQTQHNNNNIHLSIFDLQIYFHGLIDMQFFGLVFSSNTRFEAKDCHSCCVEAYYSFCVLELALENC